jgi:hypothetical protein
VPIATARCADAETGRAEIDQHAIDILLPIVDAQEGDLPEIGVGIDIMTPLNDQRRRLPVLGDLERCLAWGLIESE